MNRSVGHATTPAPRLDGLDALRALAILGVLFFHAPAVVHDAMPAAIRSASAHGWMGVDLFFVLSGYLIGRQVFGRLEDAGTGARLRTFWVKRWMRTLPLYFLVLAAYALKPWVVGTPFLGGGWHFALFLQNFTDLRDFVQSWSLCVEEHFYLVLPLLAFGLRGRRWPAWAWLVPVAVSMLVRGLVWSGLPADVLTTSLPERLPQSTFQHLDGLGVGVFLAKTSPVWRAWAPRWRAACGVLGLAVLALTVGLGGAFVTGRNVVWMLTGLAVGFGGLLVGLESLRLPTLARRAVYPVAVLSYGAYLWHGLMVRVIEKKGLTLGAWPLDLLVFLGATLAVAAVTYAAVEKPCLRWRDGLLARLASGTRREAGAEPPVSPAPHV